MGSSRLRQPPTGARAAAVFLTGIVLATLAATTPASASSSLCAGVSPSVTFNPPVAAQVSHPDYETRQWRMKLRTGPSLECEDNFIWADDNLAVEQLGTLVEPATGTQWSRVRFQHNGYTKQRWVETWSVTGTGGTGGCSGATPDQRFDPPVSARVSHPRFEERSWRMKLRTGPSLACESGHIWAVDNLPVQQLGTFVEAGTDTKWSLVRFQHNGSTLERWVETWSVEGGATGGSGGCSGASPSDRFDPPVSARVSHPDFEDRGWRMKLRTGPSLTCESGFIWANDNLPVQQLGTFTEASTGTNWSLVRYDHNGSSAERWVETWSVEQAGTGGCSGAVPSDRIEPATSARVSHPNFEDRGWRMKLRTGPSMTCEAGFIWAADNLAVKQLGTFTERATGTNWSQVRFTHNGSTRNGWVETWSLEVTGGSGGCSGASPSTVNNPPVSARVSHPRFEDRGWLMKLRTGPSMTCEAGFIWAADNLAVEQLGTYTEGSTGTNWSFVRFDDNGSSKRRWVETWSVEQSGSGGPVKPVDPPPGGMPVIIFDTDMGPDIDDALALAALHEYADQGRAHIAAVTVSRNGPAGARYVDQVNTFYGRPDIPIGMYRNTMGSTGFDGANNYTGTIGSRRDWHPYDVNADAVPHGYELMRAVLEASPDNSVVIIQVGFSPNTAELLNRYPDLVRRKARLLSIMAGNVHMPAGNPSGAEFNVQKHVVSAQIVFDKWPNDLVMSEYDLGARVLYPDDDVAALPSGHIIRDSYFGVGGKVDMSWHPAAGMKSWDITSVIAAIEPGFIDRELGPGRVTVDGEGRTRFTAGGGRHFVLSEGRHLSDNKRTALIDKMVRLVSSPPQDGNDDPPTLDVVIRQPQLRCNGALKVVGLVSGFRDGESVTVTVGSSDYTKLAPGGVRTISWRCFDGGSPIRFEVVGASGASTEFTIATYGQVTRPEPPPCATDSSSPAAPGTYVTTTTGAVAYASPVEPFPTCTGRRVRSVGAETTHLVTRESAGYYLIEDIGWIRKSLTSRPQPCDVGTILVYDDEWYRAKRTTKEFVRPLEPYSSTCRSETGTWITRGAEFRVTAFSGGYARVGSGPRYTWVRASAIELADPPDAWCPVFDPSYTIVPLPSDRGIVSTKGLGWLGVTTRNAETANAFCVPGATIPAGVVLPIEAQGVNFIVTRYQGARIFVESDGIEIYAGGRPFDPFVSDPDAWGICSGTGVSVVAGDEEATCYFANNRGDVARVTSASSTFGVQLGAGANLAVAEADIADLSRLGGWSSCGTIGASALAGVFISNCQGDGAGSDVMLRGITIGVGFDFALVGGRSLARVDFVTAGSEKVAIRNRICDYGWFFANPPPFCGEIV